MMGNLIELGREHQQGNQKCTHGLTVVAENMDVDNNATAFIERSSSCLSATRRSASNRPVRSHPQGDRSHSSPSSHHRATFALPCTLN